MNNTFNNAFLGFSRQEAGGEVDSNFNQTVLLLHGDGTNGAQNNSFLDSSTNNFTITRNGNTTQGTFSPFSAPDGRWSNNLSSSANFTFTGTTATLLDGDFTWECWVYLNSYVGGSFNELSIYNNRSGASTGTQIDLGNSVSGNAGTFVLWHNGSVIFSTATVSQLVPLNTWTHLAIVREGSATNNISVYIAGTRVLQATSTASFFGSSGTFYIGSSIYSQHFNNILSNLRVTKGGALYSGTTITVPTTSLTTSVSAGTVSLLTSQSNRFVDNSASPITLTANTSPKVTPFSPFAPTAAYDASVNGGSGYFDGSGDSLQAPSGASISGTGDFTAECWIYPTVVPGTYNVIGCSDTTNGLTMFGLNANGTIFYGRSLINVQGTTSNSVTFNAWNHIAISRSSGTLKMFVNGTEGYSATQTYSYASGVVRIGTDGGGSSLPYTGYISNYRIIQGSAVYTSNFTPPTAPLTAITNTSLLCNFTNAGIFDNTGKNNLETVANAQIDTTTKKFGTGALEFVRSPSSYLVIPNQYAQFSFGTGDFTVEAWVYLNTLPAGNGYSNSYWIVGGGPANSNTGFDIAIGSTNLQVGLTNFASLNISYAHGMTTGTWYHIAIVRSGSTLYVFKDGVQLTTASVSGVSADPCVTGIAVSAAEPSGSTLGNFNGYIDDLRITKGVARYTANFTPPTKAFPDL